MALGIKINGTTYNGFKNASVLASITAVARGFSFTSSAEQNNSYPVKIGDAVTITADDIEIIEGYIEAIEIQYNSQDHSIRVNGRSKLSDLVDSSVPNQFEYDGTTLEAIASSLLSSLGLTPKIINDAGTIRDFKDEITSAEIGQNAFEFLEAYSRKRQILLTSDGTDSLILARAGTEKAPAMLKNVSGAADNNILSSSLRIDEAKRYNQYLVNAQLNPTTTQISASAKDISDQQGLVYDADIRTSRKLALNSEESMDSFSAYDRALWEKNIRIGQAFTYQATVAGNSVNGNLWLPNTLIQVVDEFTQVNAELLIKDVQYDFDTWSGSTTTLTMIKREAFTLQVEQTERDANSEATDKEYLV